jgi:hypothetical protein
VRLEIGGDALELSEATTWSGTSPAHVIEGQIEDPAWFHRDLRGFRPAVHAGEPVAQHRVLLECCYGGAFSQRVTVRAAGDVDVLASFPGDDHSQRPSVFTSALEYSFACPGETPTPVTLDYRDRQEDDTLTDQFDVVGKRD